MSLPPEENPEPSAATPMVLRWPRALLVALLVVLAALATQAPNFRLDASADSLLIENDPDLKLWREVTTRYETADLLLVTFSPDQVLFAADTLDLLKAMRDELREVPGVESVTSILDVPLVKSSNVPLTEMTDNVQTLESTEVELHRAVEELTQSPVFRELIISGDKLTTGILLYLERDEGFSTLIDRRNALLIERDTGGLSSDGRAELAGLVRQIQQSRDGVNARLHETITEVRRTIDPYRSHGEIHLGGVPMVADDMITFVRRDLAVFGSAVVVFLVFVLTLIFRQVRWVLLPIASCFFACVAMIGLLGWIGWDVTVISSNFLALMLIITISINIHLTVRYLQLHRDRPGASQRSLVAETIRLMVWPCLYTALTTIIGFGSLVFSGIKPVRDFGWMMSMGLGVAFLVSFTLFPAILVMLEPKGDDREHEEVPLMKRLASITEHRRGAILGISLALAVASVVGVTRLEVENSFIDYFRVDTEIYQGMKRIDEKLGGTTPLEITLDFSVTEEPLPEPIDEGEDDEFDEFDDFLADAEDESEATYWFTPFKIDRIKRVHDWLDAQPEIGKVLSLASLVRVAEDLNDGQPLETLELGIVYDQLPADARGTLIDPYVSIENDEARIWLRILDSQPDLRRGALLERIQTGLEDEVGLPPERFSLVGTLVLYNNMLQSLYSSQIRSLGAVMAGIGVMFVLLFRSVRLALIVIVPNLLAAGIVLGLMGLVGIRLDVMTITIAAITIAIAVDDGIHYVYRFREEFARNGDYTKTLHICHGSIGRAVFYTSVTVIFGFSILILSNFIPTIYFGVLTGLAMLIALLSSLTLLPLLILVWKPFGPQRVTEGLQPGVTAA
ncbi:MAG: MMPL family transporter [Myxococcota bacterium]|nr:MMPL family transporter [Myxococcota bacterium]